jgi:DNA-directed RNA polymerase specialized sigma24 family protein
MYPNQALTDRQREEVVRRWVAGEPVSKLSQEFDTTSATIQKVLNKAKAIRPGTPVTPEGLNEIALCEEREQTYRENLRWAIESAGEQHRSGKRPTSCPNNSAWYLFIQAIKAPKDFLGRVGQIESKEEDDPNRELRTSTKHSVEEIEMFLQELQQEERKE